MAFRKKIHLIENLKPDIVIIQECENINKIESLNIHQKLWVGKNNNKGVGIFSFNSEYNIKLIDFNYDNNRWFIPFSVNESTTIIAVWAMNHRDNPILENIQPTYRTINNNLIKSADIIVGDFNNNVIWDLKGSKKYDKGTFEDIKTLLYNNDFVSAYHNDTNQVFGKESKPTHIWRKDYKTTYHIDYSFIKTKYLKNLTYKLLDNKEWISHSDHFPFITDISL